MTTSARPFPFSSASSLRFRSVPLLPFRSFRLSTPVSRRFLFLPFRLTPLSLCLPSVPDTQLPVLPFSPPPVPPPSGFPNAPDLFFNSSRFSPSLPPGFPFGLSGSAYSALLFVPFRSSPLRSHSRSTGAAFFFRILLPILQASSMRPLAPLPPSFVSSAVLPLPSRPFRIFATWSLFLPFPSSTFRLTGAFRVPSALLASSQSPFTLRFPPSLRSPLSPFGSFGSLRSGLGTQFRCSSFHRSQPRLTAAAVARLPSLSGSGLPLSFLLPRSPLPFRSASFASALPQLRLNGFPLRFPPRPP